MLNRRHLLTACLALGAPAGHAAPKPVFERGEHSLSLKWDGVSLATYVFRDAEVPRPYFTALRTPDGLQVTRNYPPIEGQDPTDHGTFHPGLWMAFGDLSGQDFWRNRARVVHDRFTVEPRVTGERASFGVRNRYEAADGKLLGTDICDYSVGPYADLGWLLTWDTTFRPVGPLVFGDQEEMGLGVRMATPLTVKSGGTILSSGGRKDEKEVWGQSADWCAYSGALLGRQAGIVLMSHPGNFRPPWFHARDYGLLVANAFGRSAFKQGARSVVTVAPGETLRLRYGVLVLSAPGGAVVDFASAYATYRKL